MAKNNLRQTATFNDYYSRLKNIALSVFEWEGLPETCNARFLEECLFKYGQAIFVNDDRYGFLNLKVNASDSLNFYEEPIKYTAHSIGYGEKTFDRDKCVIVRNNYLCKSTDSTALLYAEKLTKIDLAIQTNINAQKTPILLRCDSKTKTSLEAIYRAYDGDNPVIFGHKALQEKPVDAISTGAPFVADKLRQEKTAEWNEYLEHVGINTNPSDKKKERLIVSEVDSNNESIDIQGEAMLLCRQQACEEANKLFGWNCSVKLRVHEENEEGIVNGEVHN